jgi:hypothetical protein
MLPPDYGRIARLSSYLHALIETMAIAFVGTLAAGFVALPLGLLAARNVLPVWIFRFSIRRGLRLGWQRRHLHSDPDLDQMLSGSVPSPAHWQHDVGR